MFQTIKENLNANRTFYTNQEIVGFFQITTSGLKEDCENCKYYPIITNIMDYIRQAYQLLQTLQALVNRDDFYLIAQSKIGKTIELFEQVPSHLSVMDLTSQE